MYLCDGNHAFLASLTFSCSSRFSSFSFSFFSSLFFFAASFSASLFNLASFCAFVSGFLPFLPFFDFFFLSDFALAFDFFDFFFPELLLLSSSFSSSSSLSSYIHDKYRSTQVFSIIMMVANVRFLLLKFWSRCLTRMWVTITGCSTKESHKILPCWSTYFYSKPSLRRRSLRLSLFRVAFFAYMFVCQYSAIFLCLRFLIPTKEQHHILRWVWMRQSWMECWGEIPNWICFFKLECFWEIPLQSQMQQCLLETFFISFISIDR